MATSTLPKGALWMQNVNYPASWDRTLIDALYASEGVISGFAVAPAGGLDITIQPGQAIVAGDEVANQGKYLVDSDAVITLTLGSVGVARTEYVYIAINDAAVAGGRPGNNVTVETSETLPADSVLLLATLTLPGGTATITAGMIADNRVYADVVAPASITTAKLADGAVTTGKIADDAVTTAKIGPAAVGSTEIADNAVTTGKIAAGAVGTTQLADNSVTTAKIAAGAVGTTDIADDAVTNPKIGPGAVGSTELASGAVTSGKIAAGVVTATELASSSVTNAKIGADAVNGSNIADDSINSEHYVDGSIDAVHLSSNAVTNAKIADDAVTDAKIGAPTTGSLNGGTLRYARYGNLVAVWTSGEADQDNQVIPSGFRPAANVFVPCIRNPGGTPTISNILIPTSGTINAPGGAPQQFSVTYSTV